MDKVSFSQADVEVMTPRHFRQIVRQGLWTEHTGRACRNYAQANLAIVPEEYAFDFLLFCHRNPRPCPLLDVTEPGDPRPKLMAPDADLRTDLPKYCVFKDGEIIDEPTDITKYWRDDLVCFLLGCALSLDWYFHAANINYRLLGAYTTTMPCISAGPFKGNMVVGCRLFRSSDDAVRAIQISSRYPTAHGTPIHIGDPTAIGIKDLYQPDVAGARGAPPQEPGEIALYWAAGATVAPVAKEAKLPFMITHRPAHMFVTDLLLEELAVI